jgi:glycosyltransferase involved in cell wall biosynthesis
MVMSEDSPADKKRILLIARSLQMGGVERNTVNLANTLVEMGHEVHILALKKRYLLQPEPAVHVHFFDIDKVNRLTIVGLFYDVFTRVFIAPFIPRTNFVWRGLYYSFYLRHYVRYLEGKFGRFDKIIARGQGAFELFWKLRDNRFYQVIVSPLWEMKGGFLEKLTSRLLYSEKNLVVNSSGVKASLMERLDAYGISARSVTYIPNPIPVDRIKQLSLEPTQLPEEPYIVHVGRLTFQKDQELLLRAYHAAEVNEKLVIVGSGKDEQKLRRLTEQLGMVERVLFVGQKTNPYPWMRGAKLFVLSSRFEGFGLVMAEALACGTQVVAVDCPGGVRDVLIDEQADLIAEPTVAGLAEKIRLALREPVTINPVWVTRFDATKIAVSFIELS